MNSLKKCRQDPHLNFTETCAGLLQNVGIVTKPGTEEIILGKDVIQL